MKRLVQVTVQAVIEVENESEVAEVVAGSRAGGQK